MKEVRLVLNGKAGKWFSVENVKLSSLIRTGNELNNLGYNNWYLEWR